MNREKENDSLISTIVHGHACLTNPLYTSAPQVTTMAKMGVERCGLCWGQCKLKWQPMKQNMMKPCGKELIGTLDNRRPRETIIGNCGITWPINADKSWDKEEGTKV
ncbi:hypothetical protein EMCRGX_G006598 [Ephydatia muelleri]